MRAGHLPLKEICYALGYTAPSHFTNWFRKQFGETPRAMRRRGL
ncbi:MAG: helix-turn-helix domain-containing protein [Verrucomicrobiota bacterium]